MALAMNTCRRYFDKRTSINLFFVLEVAVRSSIHRRICDMVLTVALASNVTRSNNFKFAKQTSSIDVGNFLLR